MKRIKIIASLIAILACANVQATPKSQESQGLYLLGLIFGVKKDSEGNVKEVRLAQVQDTASKQQIDFQLPEHLMVQASNKIKKYNAGIDERSESQEEFFVICIYTNLDPELVRCGGDE
ncbi:hypothetical protein [Microbulbifer sp. THAF38]|uniref:hypothetical protein n=1 Tax=Microbulbifer sp. THAF38 TaxID=2587856 RepID=UPI001267E7AA|nr:hypothetical protein [Microbulbifer sp. THAF38]QFT54441.1 hypothetical protein FIU95_07730 [Microbulbifer sp. THAF38]